MPESRVEVAARVIFAGWPGRSVGWDGAFEAEREQARQIAQSVIDALAAPVRVPEDGAQLAEDLREASAEVRSWPADQQRSQGVRGIAPPRHDDGSPVPEDGAEGAREWTVQRSVVSGLALRILDGPPLAALDVVKVREVRVPVEARDHDVMPSKSDGLNPGQLSSNPEQLPPAPVSEEPEGAWTPPRSRCAGGPFGTGGGNA